MKLPLKKCIVKGKSGWKWGDSGKCYTGTGAKKKAIKQGVAIGKGKLPKHSLSEDLITTESYLIYNMTITEDFEDGDFAYVGKEGNRFLQYKINGETNLQMLMDCLKIVDYIKKVPDDEFKKAEETLMNAGKLLLEEYAQKNKTPPKACICNKCGKSVPNPKGLHCNKLTCPSCKSTDVTAKPRGSGGGEGKGGPPKK